MLTADDIRKARETASESQSVFGARFGVDQSTIHRWETVGPPKRALVQNAIARALKLKPGSKKTPANLSADDFLPASSMRGE